MAHKNSKNPDMDADDVRKTPPQVSPRLEAAEGAQKGSASSSVQGPGEETAQSKKRRASLSPLKLEPSAKRLTNLSTGITPTLADFTFPSRERDKNGDGGSSNVNPTAGLSSPFSKKGLASPFPLGPASDSKQAISFKDERNGENPLINTFGLAEPGTSPPTNEEREKKMSILLDRLDDDRDMDLDSPTDSTRGTRGAIYVNRNRGLTSSGFNLWKAILSNNDLTLQVSQRFDADTFVTMYATCKTFHQYVDTHMASYILGNARYHAPIDTKIFKFSWYENLGVRDPRGTCKPDSSEVRNVPGLKYLRMIHYRKQICRTILACIKVTGLQLPPDARVALRKIWFMMDLPLNFMRAAYVKSKKNWTEMDLRTAIILFMKIQMRFTDPITGKNPWDQNQHEGNRLHDIPAMQSNRFLGLYVHAHQFYQVPISNYNTVNKGRHDQALGMVDQYPFFVKNPISRNENVVIGANRTIPELGQEELSLLEVCLQQKSLSSLCSVLMRIFHGGTLGSNLNIATWVPPLEGRGAYPQADPLISPQDVILQECTVRGLRFDISLFKMLQYGHVGGLPDDHSEKVTLNDREIAEDLGMRYKHDENIDGKVCNWIQKYNHKGKKFLQMQVEYDEKLKDWEECNYWMPHATEMLPELLNCQEVHPDLHLKV